MGVRKQALHVRKPNCAPLGRGSGLGPAPSVRRQGQAAASRQLLTKLKGPSVQFLRLPEQVPRRSLPRSPRRRGELGFIGDPAQRLQFKPEILQGQIMNIDSFVICY